MCDDRTKNKIQDTTLGILTVYTEKFVDHKGGCCHSFPRQKDNLLLPTTEQHDGAGTIAVKPNRGERLNQKRQDR